ncbi:hypothetical protein I79_026063 [Cricetulus griseus]|uniref:Uncharacterized protein n=1 Tax=Cricetulus griseus TaxID=10029 RepID=G3IPX8_CRIGR|nr:hypothetical protein I79_026063 [Cricetulus griseus]
MFGYQVLLSDVITHDIKQSQEWKTADIRAVDSRAYDGTAGSQDVTYTRAQPQW